MFVEPGNTYVNKLRATGGSQDALALRIRLERALAGARLHPSGLPASGILCVRKLRDPMPGGLRIEGGSVQAPVAWERAVAESLDQLAARAARPALGYVPLNADAVVFLDRPEFLACLAIDWLEGAAATRWWWRSIFEALDATSAVVHAWMEALEYVPVALVQLVERGKAAEFVSSLGESKSRMLLNGITRRFALQELEVALDVVLQDISDQYNAQPRAVLPDKRPGSQAALAVKQPPWRRWAKETRDRELAIAQESLLGIGLMLVRAPAVVRSRSFVKELLKWHTIETGVSAVEKTSPVVPITNPVYESSDRREPMPATRDLAETDETRNEMLQDRDTFQRPPGDSDRPNSRAELLNTVVGRSDENAASIAPEAETRLTDAHDEPLQLNEVAVPELAHEAAAESSLALVSSLSQEASCDAPVETQIETEFGGIFYLINVGLFLNLYGDFTTPAEPGIDLSIWDFVALTARDLAGSEIETDPVWKLLAQLSGRSEGESPGQAFEPPDSWRLPSEWLAAFPEESAFGWEITEDTSDASVADRRGGRDAHASTLSDQKGGGREVRASGTRRLRVWHSEGFLVVDVPLDEDAEQQLERETREYKTMASLEFRSEPSESKDSSKLERWLAWLIPYVRARLARALGIHVGAALRGRPSPWPEEGAAPGSAGIPACMSSGEKEAGRDACAPRSLPELLLDHRARVVVSATHLDVFFSLEDHPLEIRLAGLDRDAGWVPAAGRYVSLHYQ
ncbi:MAG TPA: hypothetical protein VFB82_17750 [Blastocatellia bacterium]|nr:hypothetical protein [Blastocatellia bacterium]